MEIIPAILVKSYEDLKQKIALVRGLVQVVQIDICDGIFVPSRTWPFFDRAIKGTPFLDNNLDEHFKNIINEEEGMPFWEDIDFELDLMVVDAVSNFDIYTKLGAKRVIFHLEAEGNVEEFRDFLEGIDMYTRDAMNIGVAIGPNASMDDVFLIAPHIDFIQCMGINKIGFQGEVFDEKCLENIRTIRKKFPEMTISVDGGVNMENAPEIIKAGANRLVAGSAIFKQDDIKGGIDDFNNLFYN